MYIQRLIVSNLVSPCLHTSKKFSSGTINPKQTNKQTNTRSLFSVVSVSVAGVNCSCYHLPLKNYVINLSLG